MKKKIGRALLYTAAAALLVWLDQWTKALTLALRKGQPQFELIRGVLHLTYVENRGAIFGIGQNSTTFFAVLTPVCLAFVIYLYVKTPNERKFWWLRALCMLIAAGAVGNLIDRLSLGFVVDMIYFVPIDFPVFNVADCYVTVGTFGLAALLLFWKELGDKMFPETEKKDKNHG